MESQLAGFDWATQADCGQNNRIHTFSRHRTTEEFSSSSIICDGGVQVVFEMMQAAWGFGLTFVLPSMQFAAAWSPL